MSTSTTKVVIKARTTSNIPVQYCTGTVRVPIPTTVLVYVPGTGTVQYGYGVQYVRVRTETQTPLTVNSTVQYSQYSINYRTVRYCIVPVPVLV